MSVDAELQQEIDALKERLADLERRAAAKEREQKKRDAEIARERGEDVPED